jgi:hypothetical protein
MTMGDYALALATDNCPGIQNTDQADADADGIGNPCDVDLILIQTGGRRGAINPAARGQVGVAILDTPLLDLSQVDTSTLAFGPNEAPALRVSFEDVNGDGSPDLLARFRIDATGIATGDTEACLTGVIGLTEFVVCDDITTVP